MRRFLITFGLLASCCLSALFAQEGQGVRRPESRYGVFARFPVSNLPPQVQAPDGKVTVFADFSARDARGVPIYVVNRTAASVVFPLDGGDIYLKLQHQLPGGDKPDVANVSAHHRQ